MDDHNMVKLENRETSSNQKPELIEVCATAITVSINDVNNPFGGQVSLPDVVAET